MEGGAFTGGKEDLEKCLENFRMHIGLIVYNIKQRINDEEQSYKCTYIVLVLIISCTLYFLSDWHKQDSFLFSSYYIVIAILSLPTHIAST